MRAAALAASALALVSGPRRLRHRRGPPLDAPLQIGLLATSCTPERAAAQARAGIRLAVLDVAWDRYEPRPGAFDDTYAADVRQRVTTCENAGVAVVLGPGLQYPPRWVLDLPAGTYRNQAGETPDPPVANLVFSRAVREAAAGYLRRLDADLGLERFAAIRIGTTHTGELGYPGPGHAGAYWAFDEAAQGGAGLADGSRATPAAGLDAGRRRSGLRAGHGLVPVVRRLGGRHARLAGRRAARARLRGRRAPAGGRARGAAGGPRRGRRAAVRRHRPGRRARPRPGLPQRSSPRWPGSTAPDRGRAGDRLHRARRRLGRTGAGARPAAGHLPCRRRGGRPHRATGTSPPGRRSAGRRPWPGSPGSRWSGRTRAARAWPTPVAPRTPTAPPTSCATLPRYARECGLTQFYWAFEETLYRRFRCANDRPAADVRRSAEGR